MEEDVAEIVVQKSPDGAVTVMLTDDDGETTPVILHQSYAEELRDKLIEALQPDDQLESSSAALVEACAQAAASAVRGAAVLVQIGPFMDERSPSPDALSKIVLDAVRAVHRTTPRE